MDVCQPPFYSENVSTMYNLIQTAPLRFPSILKDDARSLLTGLICRDPATRLCSSEEDFEELRRHPFFSSIDWDKLYARELEAPSKPTMKVRSDVCVCVLRL